MILFSRLPALDPRLVIAVLASLAALTLPVVIHFLVPIDRHLAEQTGYAALFFIGLLGGVTLFLPVPMLPLVFAGGGILDPYFVALSAAGGMTAGLMVTYVVGKLGSGLTQRLATRIASRSHGSLGGWTQKATTWYSRSGMRSSFLLAVVPNPICDLSGLIAGSLKVPARHFAAGIFLGKTVQTLGVAMAGFYAADHFTWLRMTATET